MYTLHVQCFCLLQTISYSDFLANVQNIFILKCEIGSIKVVKFVKCHELSETSRYQPYTAAFIFCAK